MARRAAGEDGTQRECAARILVNAAGPWTAAVRKAIVGDAGPETLRLVKGSHLVTPRLYEGSQAYLLQNDDGRIAFVIPFEGDFSLVGTTEVSLQAPDAAPRIDAAEAEYLCALASRFFHATLTPDQAAWSYSGIRALYDDGQGSATAVSREYRLTVDGGPKEAPLLSIFGGKLTTYRRLAERVLDGCGPGCRGCAPRGAGRCICPAAAWARTGCPACCWNWLGAIRDCRRNCSKPWRVATARWPRGCSARRRRKANWANISAAACMPRRSITWSPTSGRATAEDILWRRTKCGLRVDAAGRARLADLTSKGGGT
jgi:glycerol-3-phosphate dehydrogenase